MSDDPVQPIPWDRATDPDLPPGVVAFQDGGDGNWWRYPLIEFTDDPPVPASSVREDGTP